MIRYLTVSLLYLIFALCLTPVASAQAIKPLQNLAETIVEEDKLVALAISTYQVGDDNNLITEKAAAGLRVAGNEDKVSLNDMWHIGSCTKAMTALLYTDVMKDKGLSLDTPVADIFKGSVDVIDPAWNTITIEDLLTHRAGIKDLGAGWMVGRLFDQSPLREQRLETAAAILGEAPKLQIGEFQYSNFGYILVGAAIETLTGQDWEEAMRAGLPGRLMGEDGWGYGPPQGAQPEGHRKALFRKKFKSVGQPLNGADNPRALGPAGTVHATHDAWANFALAFLPGETAIPEPIKAKLLTSPEGGDYALGWGISETEEDGIIYTHSGSNTMWLAQITVIPQKRAVVIVTTNTPLDQSRDAVRKASREAVAGLK